MGAFEDAVTYTVEKMISSFNCQFHGFNIPRENNNVWTKVIEYECLKTFTNTPGNDIYIKGQIYELNIEPDQLGYVFDSIEFKLVNEYVRTK